MINSITVPRGAAESTQLGLDLDGDGHVENALGQNLSIVSGVLGVDLNAPIVEALAEGELLHLLMFAESELDDVFDTGRLFLGEDTDADPDNNFSGAAELAVRDGVPLDNAVFGDVGPDEVALSAGELTIENVLFAAVRVTLTGAGITGTFDADGHLVGRLGGGIQGADLEQFKQTVARAIATEGNAMCDPDATPCCPPESRGAAYMKVFDADDSCELTDAEVLDGDLFQTMTAPDVDLDGDGTDDAVSVGFGITAVPATFAIPE